MFVYNLFQKNLIVHLMAIKCPEIRHFLGFHVFLALVSKEERWYDKMHSRDEYK